jgi:hypothetical protein
MMLEDMYELKRQGKLRKSEDWAVMEYIEGKHRLYRIGAIPYDPRWLEEMDNVDHNLNLEEEKELMPQFHNQYGFPGYNYSEKRMSQYRRKRRRRKGRTFFSKVAKVMRKLEKQKEPTHVYNKVFNAQVSWDAGSRASYTSSMFDYDGDIKAEMLPNIVNVPDGQSFVDPSLEQVGRKVAVGAVRQRYFLEIMNAWKHFTFRNNNTHDMTATAYILEPKMDLDNTQTVEDVWTTDLSSEISVGSNVAAADVLQMLNMHPLMSSDFHRKYRVCNKQRIHLNPGEELKLTMKCGYKKLDLAALYERNEELSGTLNHVLGLTKILYILWQGTLVHGTDAGVPNTTVGFGPGLVDIAIHNVWKMRFVQSSHYKNLRMYDATSASVANEEQAGANEDMEEDDVN